MNQAAASVVKTLAYSDIFDYPLTKQEIFHRLISGRFTPLDRVNQALVRLVADGYVKKSGSYYHLPGRNHLVKRRLQALNCSQPKIATAAAVALKLSKLPYVKAVFLTGAVAVKNAYVKDDIDLMIITEVHSLWTVRLLVTIWLELHRLRRRPRDKFVANKICANLYLSQDRLAVPKPRRSLYTAYEIIQVRPLFDPFNLHAKFLQTNSWVSTYLKNFALPARLPQQREQPTFAPVLLEKLLYQLQLAYMNPRKTRELVETDSAYFHPRDLAQEVITLYNRKLESILS